MRLRLARLEAVRSPGFQLIIVEGGPPALGEDTQTATAGGRHRWVQELDETFEAFEARVVREAQAAGERQAIIGSLPIRDLPHMPAVAHDDE